ncbi:hypothetical protein CU102_09660 [Phyllobacterium brassicacearum]|uniref:Uncharacterized protein n=1 Tax=Phyllobacterium brassicacearum TaxID=314235 RepID=A0A2P7BRG7_9HYPH|nr:hypothetical protein [Phyllobacterium brassicacearum]PSH69066.1 hypothetical protein CU102_09660 [Phyllobacterium brassicacearum]TDQ25316.1 hypothetical protein DEV91_11496 [Phyllobacterium brassicacearum]
MSRYLDRRWFLATMTVVLITAGAVCGMWISRLVVISGDRGQTLEEVSPVFSAMSASISK